MCYLLIANSRTDSVHKTNPQASYLHYKESFSGFINTSVFISFWVFGFAGAGTSSRRCGKTGNNKSAT